MKSVETMQCGSILQNQHCSLTHHVDENSNSENTYETVTACLGEIRKRLRYSAMLPKYNLQFLVALIFVLPINDPVVRQTWETYIKQRSIIFLNCDIL